MNARMMLLSVITSLFVAPCVRAASLDAVVASFFPNRLVQLTNDEGTSPLRYQSYESTSFDEPDQSYIVATYTNGFYGAVRVLKSVAGGWVLAAEPSFDGMTGKFPEVVLRDVTGDGTPEVIAAFADERGERDWIFQWQNHELKLISPTVTVDNTRFSELSNVELLDTDEDGVPEVIDAKRITDGSGDASPVDTLLKWSNDHFAVVGQIAYRGIFNRGLKGQPSLQRDTFSLAQPAPHYQLTVINGGMRGAKYRTSSAEIRLNGILVVPASEFNQQRAVITVPVTLAEENSISVSVAADLGSQIAIVLMPTP